MAFQQVYNATPSGSHRCRPRLQVFDDKATFAEWFGNVLGKAAAGEIAPADEWLETEKRVVVIHRLHQILEPFMLRRQVQDVEGKLPPKVRAPRIA